MDRSRVPCLAVFTQTAAMMALTACGGSGSSSDARPPFDMQTGVVATDLDGDGRVDVVTSEGPKVLYNDASRPGTLQAARPL